jgi:hypothetical protein
VNKEALAHWGLSRQKQTLLLPVDKKIIFLYYHLLCHNCFQLAVFFCGHQNFASALQTP